MTSSTTVARFAVRIVFLAFTDAGKVEDSVADRRGRLVGDARSLVDLLVAEHP